jgi:hypothetical protein
VHGGREVPIGELRASLRRGWLRGRLVLRRERDIVADVRSAGRWTEIGHRMDAFAHQDDELDFGPFLARRINEPHAGPGSSHARPSPAVRHQPGDERQRRPRLPPAARDRVGPQHDRGVVELEPAHALAQRLAGR